MDLAEELYFSIRIQPFIIPMRVHKRGLNPVQTKLLITASFVELTVIT